MNENRSINSISKNDQEVSDTETRVAVSSALIQDVQEVQATVPPTTYDTFIWILNYTKMFATRLGRDLFASLRSYFNSEQVLPEHISNLIRVQSDLCKERELHSATYSRYNIIKCTSSNMTSERSIQSLSLVPESIVKSPAYRTQ